MNLLVSGGNGFVMSNFVRAWLECRPNSHVVILDFSPLDDQAASFFAPVRDRISWIRADICKMEEWSARLGDMPIDVIVHGATVTPHPYVDASGILRDPEREDPGRVIDINIGGTKALLEFARRCAALRRFIYVSTGSVYGDKGPALPETPLPEEGHVAPQTLYGISKYASELVVKRYGALYGLPVASVRLASVYGPMDRPNSTRHVHGAPNLVATLALRGEPLKVHSFDGVGDWIHAADVAQALRLLVLAPDVKHDVYNVAYGRAETMRNLIDHTAEVVPLTATPASSDTANVRCDPDRRAGQWGAYDITRMQNEFDWSPAPLRQRMHEYINWLREDSSSASGRKTGVE